LEVYTMVESASEIIVVARAYPKDKRRKCVARQCVVCATTFLFPVKDKRDGAGQYCSLSCHGRDVMAKKHDGTPQNGELNPNWKGGISKDVSRYTRLYEARHPKQATAQRLVQDAVRHGRMARQPCEICGDTIGIHAHHDDYDQPLKVKWFCGRHHRIHHGATC
jgi:hypothetical protein